MAFSSEVKQLDSGGRLGGDCYELRWQDTVGGGIPCYMARNFGVKSASLIDLRGDWRASDVSGHARAGWGMLRNTAGKGIAVLVTGDAGVWKLQIGTADTWAQPGSFVKTVSGITTIDAGEWYTIHIKCEVTEDKAVTVTAEILTIDDPEDVVTLAEATCTLNVERDDFCGFYGADEQTGGTQTARYDGPTVSASGSIAEVVETTATAYVVTFNNDLGQEGPPSLPSKTKLRSDGAEATVTMPTTAPAEYGIVSKNLYRAVTGATGTVFVLVAAEIALATATYVDALDDAEIANNDILESDEWDLPPDDLEGIIALPNGIMAGFRRNQLCLSEANRPHAWPVRYRKPVDTDIVAIANIDNTIVIGTKSFVYTATGNTPGSYSMSKPGEPQACVSKRGMVYLTDVGVVFPSPDGFMVCAGSAGQVSNLTSSMFTKRQWQALHPESIICAVHDGVLFFWCDGPNPDSGYALDIQKDGFGLIRLSHHASAVHVDPLTDALYLVLDANSEPTDVLLPEPGTAPTVNGKKIYEFDAGSGSLVFRWRGKLNLMPYPVTFEIAQVRAPSYANIVLRVYGDGALIHERVLTNIREFVLPAFDTYDTVELELIGTTTVRTVQVAEDVQELA